MASSGPAAGCLDSRTYLESCAQGACRVPAASCQPPAASPQPLPVTEHGSGAGAQVICVDNFFTGSKDNISTLLGKPNFEVIRHDITERLVLEVDQIYHLACPASPVHYKCAPHLPIHAYSLCLCFRLRR